MKRITSVILCIIFSMSILISCGAPERPLTASELLDLGDKYLRELDYEQAILYYTRVIEVEPNNVRAYIGRGDAYTALQRYDEAISDYRRVIEIDPGIPEVYIKLADVHIAIGETDQAIETLHSGLAALPENTELQSRLDMLRQELFGPGSEEMHQFLSDTLSAYETAGYDGIYSAMETAEFAALAENEPTYPVISLETNGIYGSGIYQIDDGDLYLYVGGYANRLRSGHGIWVRLSAPYDVYYRFEGEWANDKPNGEGIVNYSDALDRMIVSYAEAGFLIDGLWDGEVIHYEEREGYLGHMRYYEKGKLIVIGEAVDEPWDDLLWYPVGYLNTEDDSERRELLVRESDLDRAGGIAGFSIILRDK